MSIIVRSVTDGSAVREIPIPESLVVDLSIRAEIQRITLERFLVRSLAEVCRLNSEEPEGQLKSALSEMDATMELFRRALSDPKFHDEASERVQLGLEEMHFQLVRRFNQALEHAEDAKGGVR